MTIPAADSADTVSVAIATYNGEKFLRQQLDSIAAQTVLPTEVVITDDSPTDGTRRLAEEWAKTAPFLVRVYANPERLGYVDNFLRAASLCTGRWICFCDQDDVWMPEKLETCLRTLRETGALLAIHASAVVDTDLNPAEGREPVIDRSETLEMPHIDPWWCPPGFAMVFAADLLRFFDAALRPGSQIAEGQLPHDHWVYFLAQVVGKIALIVTPLAKYRRHAGNVTDSLPETGLKNAVTAAAKAGADLYRSKADLTHTYVAYWQARAAELPSDDAKTIPFGPQNLPVAELRRRFTDAAAFYAAVEARLRGRAALYDPASGVGGRVRTLSALIASGGYGDRRGGGLGVKSLAKDAFVVVKGP